MRGHAELLTYRYLRVAMVVTVCGLAASVVIEWLHTGRECWQTSISAYYYTPAQGMFVGTLVAMGLAMVVIKGSNDREDALLNVAGMLAPIVAFVPTPHEGSCSSIVVDDVTKRAAAENNVTALLVLGVFGFAFTLWAASRDGTWRRRFFRIGYPAAVAGYTGAVLWFWLGRDSFLANAHYAAAVPLFLCMVATAVTNAFDMQQYRAPVANRRKIKDLPRNRYALLAAAMVISVSLMSAYRVVFGWEHGVLLIEATVIVLFGAFWVIQTHELWNHTVRGVTEAAQASSDQEDEGRVQM